MVESSNEDQVIPRSGKAETMAEGSFLLKYTGGCPRVRISKAGSHLLGVRLYEPTNFEIKFLLLLTSYDPESRSFLFGGSHNPVTGSLGLGTDNDGEGDK